MTFTKGRIDLGLWGTTNFWVPDPPLPPLFYYRTSVQDFALASRT